jgi:hypothetical protein
MLLTWISAKISLHGEILLYRLLKKPCASLKDKNKVLCPTGDYHDYFSMARYW